MNNMGEMRITGGARSVATKPAAPIAPSSPETFVSEPPRATSIPYYSELRIPDLDKLKVVRPGEEMTAETERGEAQANNGAELGPGARGPILPTVAEPATPALTPTQWVMGAIALYFMFS